MKMLVSYILILSVAFARCSRNFLSSILDVPKFEDTEIVEVYHLRSFPKLLIQSVVGQFSTQIAGLALRSITTEQIVVLSYEPKNYSACFLPHIVYGNTTSLAWDLEGRVVYESNLDNQFWQQSTFLARVNGVVYKKYILWLSDYQELHKTFIPQSICVGEYDTTCFLPAVTWESFLSESLRFLAALNARINAMIPPRGQELRYIAASNPKNVQIVLFSNTTSTNEVIRMEEVVEYFDEVMSCIQDFSIAVKSCITDRSVFIPLSNSNYYRFKPRYPNVFLRDFLLDISDSSTIPISGINVEDICIISFLGFIITFGVVATMYKMKMLKLLFPEDADYIGKFRGSVFQRLWISLSERSKLFNFSRRPSKEEEEALELAALIK